MKKKTIILVSICALAVLAAAILLLRPSKKSQISLETGSVEKIDITNSVTATGTVEPVTSVDVGTQVSGIVEKLYVDYNDVVKEGQVIAEMDKSTLEAEYKTAQAALTSAKDEYIYRQKEYNRVKTLHDKELVSDSEYDQSLYYYQTAKSSYEQAQTSLVKVNRNLGYATITSPIDGIVISRAVEEGQTVAAGFETPTLFTIAKDLTKMRVIADVDEADIGQVQEGQRVDFTVDAYPDDTFEGLVSQVRLEATTTSNVVTYEVVITASNPDLKLKPGLTANVTIYSEEKPDVLSVPTKALRFTPDKEILSKLGYTLDESEKGEGKHVWIVSGNTLKKRYVETGSSSGDRTEVESGVAEGETVAITVSAEATPSKASSTERSPFAPGPRDNDKDKK